MSGIEKRKRSPVELLRAIQRTEQDGDLAAIAAMSESELDASIRSNGGDPKGIGERGARLAEELLARRKRARLRAMS
jgi:hypothetical protein